MLQDEAPSPHNNKKSKRVRKTYVILTYVLFAVVVSLVFNNFIIYGWYSNTKNKVKDTFLRVRIISQEKTLLKNENDHIIKEYDLLNREYGKVVSFQENVLKELKELKKQNEELLNENKELVEDNIELQNSLKKAASAGIKPQNYKMFNGVTPKEEIERGRYIGKFLGTAYTPSKIECGNDRGITNSGMPIIPGISVAIDREHWPFGTVFYIKGLGYAVAMDSGNAIKGKYRFDFAVFDRNFAKQLGSSYWDVYLVKLGTGKVEDISL